MKQVHATQKMVKTFTAYIATTQLAAKLLYWQFGPDNLINIKILDTDSNFTYIVPVMAQLDCKAIVYGCHK